MALDKRARMRSFDVSVIGMQTVYSETGNALLLGNVIVTDKNTYVSIVPKP